MAMVSSSSSVTPTTLRQMIQSLTNLSDQLKSHSTGSESVRRSSPFQFQPTDEGDNDGQIEETGESTTTRDENGVKYKRQTTTHPLNELLNNVDYLKAELEKMEDFEGKLNERIQPVLQNLREILRYFEESPSDSSPTEKFDLDEIRGLSKDIKNLKLQIASSSNNKLIFAENSSRTNLRRRFKPAMSQFVLPDLHRNEIFKKSSAFEDIQQIYNGLSSDLHRECFLYLSVFPKNAVLKKRFLTYWWVGEGLLDPSGTGNQTPESLAGGILQEFTEKGLIEPIKEEQKKIKKSFKLSPLVRSAAIILSKQNDFYDYEHIINPTSNFSVSDRIFLVKTEVLPQQPPQINPKSELKMKCIFNISQPFPDSALEWLARKGKTDIRTVKVVEWFLKMKNLKVLYLGRWQTASEKSHIEVENTDQLLKGLKNMKKLRLLSLRGISLINKLPNSINKLSELRILDLNSCHNLENLPEGIGSLKKLTHLDISGCYLLDWMPKAISSLTELRVLKGFVVGRSSITIGDLKGLKKLRKLSIVSNRRGFPDDTDLLTLRFLGEEGMLRNLSIEWGAELTQPLEKAKAEAKAKAHKIRKQVSRVLMNSGYEADKFLELPKQLEKLSLHCLPEENLPNWVSPSKMSRLKKLYIRGGKLRNLWKADDFEWKVEVLLVKFLSDLRMEWRKLQEVCFPNLTYFQCVKCPRVTLCPCDQNGIWRKL